MNFDFNKTQDRRQLENIWRKGSRWWSKKPVPLPPWGSSTLLRVQWSSLAYASCFTNRIIYDNRWSSWHGSIRKSYILFRSIGNFEQICFNYVKCNLCCFETEFWDQKLAHSNCYVTLLCSSTCQGPKPYQGTHHQCTVVRQVVQIFPPDHFYDYTINQCNSNLQIRQNC